MELSGGSTSQGMLLLEGITSCPKLLARSLSLSLSASLCLSPFLLFSSCLPSTSSLFPLSPSSSLPLHTHFLSHSILSSSSHFPLSFSWSRVSMHPLCYVAVFHLSPTGMGTSDTRLNLVKLSLLNLLSSQALPLWWQIWCRRMVFSWEHFQRLIYN